MNEKEIKEIKTILEDQRALTALMFSQFSTLNACVMAFMASHPDGKKLLGLCKVYADANQETTRDLALALGLSTTVQSFFDGTLPDLPSDAAPEA